MSVSAWSLSAALNAVADLLIPAHDGASARSLPGLIRAVMAGVRGLSDDRGGAIVTGGRDNAYTASSAAGVSRCARPIEMPRETGMPCRVNDAIEGPEE